MYIQCVHVHVLLYTCTRTTKHLHVVYFRRKANFMRYYRIRKKNKIKQIWTLNEMSGKRKLDSIVLSGNRVFVIIYT